MTQARLEPYQLSASTRFIGCAEITGLTISLSVVNSIFLDKAINNISADLPVIGKSKTLGTQFYIGYYQDVYITMIVAGAMTIRKLVLGTATASGLEIYMWHVRMRIQDKELDDDDDGMESKRIPEKPRNIVLQRRACICTIVPTSIPLQSFGQVIGGQDKIIGMI
ncbi:hypothetical protein BOTNAR_0134g00110 [Botryotinia narcissicola]|uniref:Uncharacterized protein n=1 Tax=Botryotinia narcissicola TaxID=278944 RepID=A0A4Z1IWC7_9HELO|nr:hypothetical protein BOTNAR_0134g00110 [Botryotinia narcissicola]